MNRKTAIERFSLRISGSGSPLVALAHGFGGSGILWNLQVVALASVFLPVLIVHSPHDAAVTVVAGKYLERHIPGSRFAVRESDSHLPRCSGPEEVNAQQPDFTTDIGDGCSRSAR